jgi:hypothetical protein
MAHNAFSGWMRAYYTGNVTVYAFNPGIDLRKSLETMLTKGYLTIYTICWTNQNGWYGDATVPQGFQLQFNSGEIGVFAYTVPYQAQISGKESSPPPDVI